MRRRPSRWRAVGLDDPAFAGRNPRDLSGGEKQRLALAVVPRRGGTAINRRRSVLDEPTRGMDRDHKHRLAVLLGGLDAAVIVATHDPEFVAAFADRVLLLADGAPIADASPAVRCSAAAATSPPRRRGSSAAPAAR